LPCYLSCAVLGGARWLREVVMIMVDLDKIERAVRLA
jgi:hypothetical protein